MSEVDIIRHIEKLEAHLARIEAKLEAHLARIEANTAYLARIEANTAHKVLKTLGTVLDEAIQKAKGE